MSEYEAEVIIHKPQQAAAEEETVASEPVAEPEAPVAATRGAVVSREQGAAYIAPEAKRMQAKPRKKAPSFFERITGGPRARDEDAEAAGATPLRQPARPAAQGRVEPRMGQRPAPEAPRQAISTQQTAAAPARDLTPDPVEEEQLEIPAFLRRQAN